METVHFITDRHNASYRLEFTNERGCWSIYVFRYGFKAAHVHCSEYPPVLKLQDLFIEKGIRQPESKLMRCWRFMTGLPAPTIPIRGLGLGTVLLEFVVTQAKNHGFSRIEGDIYYTDYSVNPGLPDWYRRRGFSVTSHPPGTKRIAGLKCEL